LTARWLGELSEAESKALDLALAANPQLAQLDQRLRQTIGLVREVAADPAAPIPGSTPRLRMSPGRRERLLEQLRGKAGTPTDTAAAGETPAASATQTVIPVDFPTQVAPAVSVPARGGSWLAVAACLVGLLLAVTVFLDPSTRISTRMAKASWTDRPEPEKPGPELSLQVLAEATSATPADAPLDRLNTQVGGFANGVVGELPAGGRRPETTFGKGVAADDFLRDAPQSATPAAPPSAGPASGIRPELMQPELMRRYGLIPAPSQPVRSLDTTVPASQAAEGEALSGTQRGLVRVESENAPVPTPVTRLSSSAESAGLDQPVSGPAVITPPGFSVPALRSLQEGNALAPADSRDGFTGGGLGGIPGGGTPAATESRFVENSFGGGGGGAGAGGAVGATFDFAPAKANQPEVRLRRSPVVAKAEGDKADSRGDLPSVNLSFGVAPQATALPDSLPLAYMVQQAPSRGELRGGPASQAETTQPPPDDSRTQPVAADALEVVNLSKAIQVPAAPSPDRQWFFQNGRVLAPGESFARVQLGQRLATNRAPVSQFFGSEGSVQLWDVDSKDVSSAAKAPATEAKRQRGTQAANLALGDTLKLAVEDQLKTGVVEAKVQQEFFGQPGNGEVQAATSSSEALVEEQAGKKPLTPLALSIVDRSKRKSDEKEMAPAAAVVAPPLVPQPEVASEENPVSTFSLNVSDVSFKLAGASLDNGQLPGPSTVRTEEFLNAFHYRDPDPAPGRPVAFAWERAQFPFAQQRDVVRLSVRTGAVGREANRPLNVVLLLDSSGSMERADRVSTIREALKVLGNQMMPQDRVSVVSFARTARLWIDGLPGDQASNLADRVGQLAPEGGTHLEEALRVGYDTARKHFTPEGVNRVVLLTDGAANLGELRAEALREMVESNRKRGVALDCFGIGFDGYQDDLLEALSRNGDGRYGFVNSPEEASTGFANQLAGALQVAAADVKVQVEFNPQRVDRWRQIGYAKHQLTQEQFRDNTVDAAEIGAAESGNALYVIESNARGTGPIGTVRVRFRDPSSGLYSEQEWAVPYEGPAQPLEQSSPALRLATAAAAFGEMLSASPYASEVSNDRLIALLNGVPEYFSPDPRPERLLNMVRQAQSIQGR
jgi:secreted protein with Ig-like and vWFA domain